MSWSIQLVGKPENIITALDSIPEKNRMDEFAKAEFDAALPHLKGIVEQNFVNPDDVAKGSSGIMLSLAASGSGWHSEGKLRSSSLTVKLEQWYGTLV